MKSLDDTQFAAVDWSCPLVSMVSVGCRAGSTLRPRKDRCSGTVGSSLSRVSRAWLTPGHGSEGGHGARDDASRAVRTGEAWTELCCPHPGGQQGFCPQHSSSACDA